MKYTFEKRRQEIAVFFRKKLQNNFADIKIVYIFAMSIKTKPTGRVAGTKKMSYENTNHNQSSQSRRN